MPISQNYHILHSNKKENKVVQIIMIEINEKEEEQLDNIKDEIIKFTSGDKIFKISNKNIICYGEINLEDENNVNLISNFNFLNYLGSTGVSFVSNYNYKTHSCTSPKRKCLWTETWNPLDLFKFAHASLGKPKRILLFNQMIK